MQCKDVVQSELHLEGSLEYYAMAVASPVPGRTLAMVTWPALSATVVVGLLISQYQSIYLSI